MLKTSRAKDNANSPWRGGIARAVLLGLALSFAGCHSVYHRAQRQMTADPCAELKLRTGEARRAEQLALAAGCKVRDSLKAGVRGDAQGFHLDRLEMTALELGRHALSVRDAAADCPGTPAEDVQGFEELSRNLAAWARQARAGEPAATVTTLETLLRDAPAR
jgi:hypothetical protein